MFGIIERVYETVWDAGVQLHVPNTAIAHRTHSVSVDLRRCMSSSSDRNEEKYGCVQDKGMDNSSDDIEFSS